ncbi:UPF0223 family protein [Shouchella shacheensis]|uniref:UPF0223 family protein n=1 Tax=Shouchella shacheensis TaxID=1649580 RepID=UPI00073FCAD4|nr:UPF0223 family protein [Shouchella shacheensis]
MDIPINDDWSQEEVVAVAQFFDTVERAYEEGVKGETLLAFYREFKAIVPSKAEEKQLFRQVDKQTGHSCFKAIKAAQSESKKTIKL